MTRYIAPDGVELDYKVDERMPGMQGTTLAFVHGWCSNLTHWEPQARHFRRRHRILRVDRRGHGESSNGEVRVSPRVHADDLAAIARRERIRRCVVVGHAGGGSTALELARSYPELVQAVVLVDAGVYPKPKIGDASDPFGAQVGAMIEALGRPDALTSLAAMYRGFFDARADRQLVDLAVAQAIRTPMPVAVAELRHVIGISTRAIARQVKQPALFVSAGPANEELVRAGLKQVEFGQVVGAGHFLQLEVPAQLNAMLATFLAQLN